MSTDEPGLVRYATAGGVATITLDSPHNRNALSSVLIGQLVDALRRVDEDDAVRAVVLSHTGPVFCSGADLRETAAALSAGEIPAGRLGEVLELIWLGRKPVVARVGGPARAGGLGLVAAADIAVCAEDATFAFTEVRLGVIPAVISATVLPRLSTRAANELYLTGEVFDGRRAESIGLVTRAVPAGELDSAVAGYMASLVRGAPTALAAAKGLLRRPAPVTFGEQTAELAELSVSFFISPEGREGVAAFREKRDPSWIPSP
jgi:methylglutaconyl-CoA hydratase